MSTALVYTTFNRTPLLRDSLARLRERTQPDEIIVVDDGGSDGCDGLCVEASEWFECPLRYIYTHNPRESICSHARNVAIKATDADVIVTTEPEMLLDTDVLAQFAAQHADDQQWGTQRILNVGTVRHAQPPGARCSCCQELLHTTINWQATWVCLYRREWLLAVGGWDESFPAPWGWDDVDLGSRLRIWGVGQHNMMETEATHQWHPSRFTNQEPNETHFKNKGFHGDERRDHPQLVANAGREWGVPVSRP